MAAIQLAGYSRASELFQLLRDGAPVTRSALAQATGLSRTTVGSRVDELVRLGLVTAVENSAPSGGRPSSQFSFNQAGRLILAFDIRSDYTAVAVTDLRGTILGRDQRPMRNADGPAVVLAGAVEMATDILRDLRQPSGLVVGIGIALAGYTEIFTGRLHTLPHLEQWTGKEIEAQLWDFLPVPILVDNDVNLMALGEHLAHPDIRDLMFVRVAAGIGAGIIAGGDLQRGASSQAGNIGHARVPRSQSIVCRCGHVGCLDTSASIRAISDALISKGTRADTVEEIVALIQEGHPDAIQVARQAGQDLGAILAVYASILNPSIIAISDPISSAEEHLFSAIREVIFTQGSPMVGDALQVVRATPTENTAITGASQMVIDHVLSPAGIEDMIAGRPRRPHHRLTDRPA